MGRVVLALLMTAILNCCHIDALFYSADAEITPNDALVFIGEVLKVQCDLRVENISPSGMYFAVEGKRNDIWNISRNATVVGNKSITTELEITNRYSNYTTLYCYNTALLDSTAIFVEYPIKNITDFKGILYYDNSTIIFTWSLGETYLDPFSITVDVDWNPFSPPELNGTACIDSNKEFCAVSWHSQSSIFIRIKVSHVKSANRKDVVPVYDTFATSVHEFLPYDNLKGGPPESLKVEGITSQCVNVSWNDSLYFKSNIFINATYRIGLKVQNESEFSTVVAHAVRENPSDLFEVCQLIPFTKYELSVQLRAKDMNPWSDPAIVVFTTREDRPLTGPPVTDTSYRTGECIDNKRDVFVYWIDPTQQSLRGVLTRFEVTKDNGPKKLLRMAYNYYTDSLNCGANSVIQVYSATYIGPSLIPSQIYIPKENGELTLGKDIMFRVEERSEVSDERSKVNATVKWNPVDSAGNVTLILYMCMETFVPYTCFNNFLTVEINLNKGEVELNDLPAMTNLFGYAAKDSRGRKHGIIWTNCVYRTDTKPDKPTDVHVTPGSQDNSLEVSWTSVQCNRAKKVLIVCYYLLICTKPADKCSWDCCTNITISDLNISKYTASGLDGGRQYYVYMQAKSVAGLSQVSDVVVGIPSVSNTGQILGIAIGTTVAVIVLGSAVFVFIRCFVKSRKQFTEMVKTYVITLPKEESDSGNCTGSYTDSMNSQRAVITSSSLDSDCVKQLNGVETSTLSSILEVTSADASTSAAVVPASKGAVAGTNAEVVSPSKDAVAGAHTNVVSGHTNPLRDTHLSQLAGGDQTQLATPSELDVSGDSSVPYMCFVNTSLLPAEVVPTSRGAVASTHAEVVPINTGAVTSTQTNIVSAQNMATSGSNNSLIQLEDAHLFYPVSPSAVVDKAQVAAPAGSDVDTDGSLQYVRFVNTSLPHDPHQQAAAIHSIFLDVPNNSSSDSSPTLQLQGTSHLPPVRQPDFPLQEISVFHMGQVYKPSAPNGDVNSDYVRWISDGNPNNLTEHCTPDSNCVVPQDLLVPFDHQILSDCSSPGQNTSSSSGQESSWGSKNNDSIVRLRNLQTDYQVIPDYNRQGQNTSSSNISIDQQIPNQQKDNQQPVDDFGYIRQGYLSQDVKGSVYQLGAGVAHHRDQMISEGTSSLLDSESDLSGDDSSWSLNIDSLISKYFLSNGCSHHNVQVDGPVNQSAGVQLESLKGVRKEVSVTESQHDSFSESEKYSSHHNVQVDGPGNQSAGVQLESLKGVRKEVSVAESQHDSFSESEKDSSTASNDSLTESKNDSIHKSQNDLVINSRNDTGGCESMNVSEASGHRGLTDYYQETSWSTSQNDDPVRDIDRGDQHSGESSQGLELDDYAVQSVSSVSESGYQPLTALGSPHPRVGKTDIGQSSSDM